MSDGERDLVAVTRALFEPGTARVVTPILRRARKVPRTLSRPTFDALTGHLRMGLVRWLAKSGANVATRFDGAGHASNGRAWERMEPPSLRISMVSFRALTWLVEANLAHEPAPLSSDAPKTLGDELVLARVALLLGEAGLGQVVATQAVLTSAPLVWWSALDLADAAPAPGEAEVRRWSSGVAADILGCLAEDLGALWAGQEARASFDPATLKRRGAARAAVLLPLVEGAIAAKRPDACAFLLAALRRSIPDESAPFDVAATPWTRPLDPTAPLSTRTEARRAGLASLRAILALASAYEASKRVGFVDEGWEEAQALGRFFHRYDEGRFARAAQVRAHVEGLTWEEPS